MVSLLFQSSQSLSFFTTRSNSNLASSSLAFRALNVVEHLPNIRQDVPCSIPMLDLAGIGPPPILTFKVEVALVAEVEVGGFRAVRLGCS